MGLGSADETTALSVVVIGHVNHGKTALVRALTGMETDRLKEEKARGLSITLGFAWRALGEGVLDLIDAPGHEDFVRAMVCGTLGARAVLLVVSAVEGFGPQTWEHLRIAALAGHEVGVTAVTKADRLGPGEADRARADIVKALAGTFLADQPIIFCSAVTGEGVAALHQALEALPDRCPPRPGPPGVFLPIDRAFSVSGAGTVVTGTLQGAALALGDEGTLYPSGRAVGVRRLQVHGQDQDQAAPGGRVAVALRGVAAGDVGPGEVLGAPGAFEAALFVDARVVLSPEARRPLRPAEDIQVLWGSRRDVARVSLLGAKALAPGETGLVQLRFAQPTIAHAGQRAILRRASPPETLGGAIVLDPAASPARGRAAARVARLAAAESGDTRLIAEALVREGGGVGARPILARLARAAEAELAPLWAGGFARLDAERFAPRAVIEAVRQAYLDALTEAHARAPARAAAAAGPVRAALAHAFATPLIAYAEQGLAAEGVIRLVGGRVALATHDPLRALSPDSLERLNRIETALRQGGVSPPAPATIPGDPAEAADLVTLLVDTGRAVALRNGALRQTLVFHRESLAEALDVLRERFPPPTAFTTGEAREALATSRKFIVPVLEYFDTLGATQREGDTRTILADPAPPTPRETASPAPPIAPMVATGWR